METMKELLAFKKMRIPHFQKELLSWFKDNQRDFPWRHGKQTTYKVILTELLLQRTKASTVAKHYPIFFKTYPDWKTLGTASESDLREILKPLGLYTQRANRLYKLAQEMKKRNGRFPRSREEVEKLPTVGQYIANAYELFILEKRKPLLDVNMSRVLERYFGPRELADIRDDPYLQELAHRVVDVREAKELNWAVLDYAQLICTARNPKCQECNLSKTCFHVQDSKKTIEG